MVFPDPDDKDFQVRIQPFLPERKSLFKPLQGSDQFIQLFRELVGKDLDRLVVQGVEQFKSSFDGLPGLLG